jgi:hypothetical protein
VEPAPSREVAYATTRAATAAADRPTIHPANGPPARDSPSGPCRCAPGLPLGHRRRHRRRADGHASSVVQLAHLGRGHLLPCLHTDRYPGQRQTLATSHAPVNLFCLVLSLTAPAFDGTLECVRQRGQAGRALLDKPRGRTRRGRTRGPRFATRTNPRTPVRRALSLSPQLDPDPVGAVGVGRSATLARATPPAPSPAPLFGMRYVPQPWIDQLDMHDTILQIGQDALTEFAPRLEPAVRGPHAGRFSAESTAARAGGDGRRDGAAGDRGRWCGTHSHPGGVVWRTRLGSSVGPLQAA